MSLCPMVEKRNIQQLFPDIYDHLLTEKRFKRQYKIIKSWKDYNSDEEPLNQQLQ